MELAAPVCMEEGVAVCVEEGVPVPVWVDEGVLVCVELEELVWEEEGVLVCVLLGVDVCVELAVPVCVEEGVLVWLLALEPVAEGSTDLDTVGVAHTGSAAHTAETQPQVELPQHAVSAQSVAPLPSLSRPSVQISAEMAIWQPPRM